MTSVRTVIDGMSPMSAIIDGWGNFKSNATEFFQNLFNFFPTVLTLVLLSHSSPQVTCVLKLLATAPILPLMLVLQNSLYLIFLI